MEKFKLAFLMVILIALCSCKKEEEPTGNKITAQDVYVTAVHAQRVGLTYKLSQLGYKETGVIYFPKDQPAEQHRVAAIRKDGQFLLSLQNLKPNTVYKFKVYYTTNEGEKLEAHEYTVTTLSLASLKFNLEVKNFEVSANDGNFSIDLEGDYLNELNLSALQLFVNEKAVKIAYPVRLTGDRYQMNIKGQSALSVSGHLITATYMEQEILAHYIPVQSNSDRYILNAKAVNLPAGWYSVYKDNLYSFFEEKVLRWDPISHRMVTLRTFEEGFVWGNTPCFEFDNQMFFVPAPKARYLNPKDPSIFEKYLAVVSYSPEANNFDEYVLPNRMFEEADLSISSSQFFIHKSELYLALTLVDLSGQFANRPTPRTHFIYKYDRSQKKFNYISGLKTDILSQHFSSIDNQMYLVGLVHVTINYRPANNCPFSTFVLL